MPKVRWSATIEGDGMLPVQLAQPDFDAGAFDRIAATLSPDDAGPTVLQVQPGDAESLKLLLIALSHYDGGVTYRLNGAGDPIAVSGPQLFSGGATALFADAVATLEFAKPSAEVEVLILVVRDATA